MAKRNRIRYVCKGCGATLRQSKLQAHSKLCKKVRNQSRPGVIATAYNDPQSYILQAHNSGAQSKGNLTQAEHEGLQPVQARDVNDGTSSYTSNLTSSVEDWWRVKGQ